MSIKAVIFDLDGTITQPYFDFDIIREEMGLDRNSGPVLESMEKMSPQQRREAEKILHFHEERAVTESRLNPAAKQTLSALRKAGIHIGILTRNKRSNALAIARKHGLKFDAIVDREDGPVKPDAFGVLKICQQFGVKPLEALVVGDYLFDILSAKAAGAVAVLLANHDRAREFVKHADFTIENIAQILQIIEEKNNL
ncbi:MAG: HAD-IA family hydrolase [Phycisphaerae bacterium]|nr:HAD family hydrolase [Candidatus Saccharibacteria bacterium]NIS53419.1 HAD family hydrolase [Phycisphaerae bacterium]NIU58747.1 HAD-IA family hydrolase [Phycisphaerae bacterium]NIV04050.1 HAD-IA family hydrolase [Calditrichia bacterium]NIV72439.1 HAD-IA family hydrolase [Calditrichia bacterium]